MKYAKAALVGLAFLSTSVLSHSWIEQIQRIDPSTGTFVDPPGYRRNHLARNDPAFGDKKSERQLPVGVSDERAKRDVNDAVDFHIRGIKSNDTLCKGQDRSQLKAVQSPGFPRLQAGPSDFIAIRYLENGHVTNPTLPPNKPKHSGNVYVYLTEQPSDREQFLDVFRKWDKEGKGGDKRGRLLGVFPFDDGRCYEKNDKPISTQRQQEFPVAANPLAGASNACQNDVQLPSDLKVGGTASIYWVWDWSTEPSAPGANDGVPEIYTSCFDVDITKNSPKGKQTRSLDNRDTYENKAIPDQMQGKQVQDAQAASPASSPSSQAPAAPAQSAQPAQPAAPASVASQAPSAAPAAPAATPACAAAPAQPASIDIQALASAVAKELGKQTKKMVTVTVTQAAAASPSSVAAANPVSTPPAAEPNSIATAVPSAMSFASPIMAPVATPATQQAQSASAAAPSQDSAVLASSDSQAQTAAPAAPSSQSATVQPSTDAQAQTASSATPSQGSAVQPIADSQAQTASPATPSQSGAVQAGGQNYTRSCKTCAKRSRIF